MKKHIITAAAVSLVWGLPAVAKDKPWEFEIQIGAERPTILNGAFQRGGWVLVSPLQMTMDYNSRLNTSPDVKTLTIPY